MEVTMGGKKETVSIAAMTAAFAAGIAAPLAQAATLAPELQKILQYKFGDSREPLTVVQDMARSSTGRGRLDLERQFAQVLGTPEATDECKDFICRQLWLLGTKESIPALEKLLESDPKYGDMARYALERNPDKRAAQALRAPLEKALKSGSFPAEKKLFYIGFVNSLGTRKDKDSISVLNRIAVGENEELAAAAVSAIGKIGGSKAKTILTEAKSSAFPTVQKTAETALKNLTVLPAEESK
jgi:hypothetical protein